jgi:predicted enzyme related to lactoylglutathione lyase
MKVNGHRAGDFCWVELGTTDPEAAGKFYSGLFDWKIDAMPMGPGEFYYLPRIDGIDVCGMYKLGPQMQNVPPHWMPYVQSDSADDSAAKVTSAGGTVVMAPFDVFDIGRMFVLKDPGGAHLSVWQPKTHKGTGVRGPRTMCWAELATRDTNAAKPFYTSVFGWGTKIDPKMNYTEWQNGGTSVGGMLQMDAQWGDAPPHWGVYFQVDDCDATLARAKELGGTVLHGPHDIPNVGRFGLIKDLQGATFFVIKLTMPT